jgi:hypothetical protein
MKRFLLALGLVAAIPAACTSSSNTSPPAASVDAGSCHPPGISAACTSCLSASCSTATATAASDCASVVSCYCACDLGDTCCVEACGPAVTPACGSDAKTLADCAVTSCGSVCAVTVPVACTSDAGAEDAGDAASDAGPADAGNAEDAADSSSPSDAGSDADAGDAAPPPPLGGCAATSLLSDCSFETPVVAAGETQQFSNGQSIGAWTVVGATGNLNTISTTFTQNGFTFEAEDGQQSMDLTGTSNTATGVAQTVTTTIGTTYQLAFWVGNVVNPGGIFGVTSTVDVQIGGTTVYSAENSGGTGTMTLDWEEFSLTFTATATSTTVGFINADPSNDTSNFIDNVTLVALPN